MAKRVYGDGREARSQDIARLRPMGYRMYFWSASNSICGSGVSSATAQRENDMEALQSDRIGDRRDRIMGWTGALLAAAGLLGHLVAANAIGGSRMAYTHHIAGFFLILVVSGAAIAGLGWRLLKTRPGIILLLIGTVQALFGLYIYLIRYQIG